MSAPVMLVDLGGIYWACWHSTANEAISEAHDRTVNAIRKVTEGHQLIAVCCDSPRNFRKDLDPTYKANRPPRDSAAYVELDRTKETLARLGFLLWECEGFEADDVIATACRAAVKADHEVVIASSDKDLTQLVQFGVTWLSPKTGEHLDRDGVRAKFGVWPEQMRDYLAICGDRSDNVRGVTGVGPKGASKLLGEWVTLEQIMHAIINTPSKVATPAVQAAIKEALEWLPLTVKLVSLRYDCPITFDQIYETHQPKEEDPVHEQAQESDLDLESEAPSESDPAEPDAKDRAPVEPPSQAANGAIEVAHAAPLVAPASWEMGLEPTSLGDAYKLAKGLHGSGLYYPKFKNPAAIWAVIIRGRELGLGALTALDCFNVVEGRPTPSAHFLIARAKAHPDCEYLEFVRGDATSATWRGKERGRPEIELTYTIEQARAAGLVKNGSAWDKRPDDMVRKQAGVALARVIVPGALLGLHSYEELAA